MNIEQIDLLTKTKSGKLKKFLAVFFIFLTIHSTFGFMEFIFEEAMQTCMFGAFSYSSAQDWIGMERHLKICQKTQDKAEFWILYTGWLAPLMWPAYLNYLDNNQAYIDSMHHRITFERNKALT